MSEVFEQHAVDLLGALDRNTVCRIGDFDVTRFRHNGGERATQPRSSDAVVEGTDHQRGQTGQFAEARGTPSLPLSLLLLLLLVILIVGLRVRV